MPGQPSLHALPANAGTVHWGYFSRTLQPQLEVNSGDLVTIETLTHHANDDAERMVKGDPGAETVFLESMQTRGGSQAALAMTCLPRAGRKLG